MYKLLKDIFGNTATVIRLLDDVLVPFDPANTDYQAFLRWCEEGNTPEPASAE